MPTANLIAYRAPHKIEPVAVWVPGGTEPDHMECDICAVEIARAKDGTYRHDRSVVVLLPRPVTWPGR